MKAILRNRLSGALLRLARQLFQQGERAVDARGALLEALDQRRLLAATGRLGLRERERLARTGRGDREDLLLPGGGRCFEPLRHGFHPPEFKRYGTDAEGNYIAATRWVDDAVQRVRQLVEGANLKRETIFVFGADHGETFGEHGVHGHARNVLSPVVDVPLVVRLPFSLQPPLRVPAQVRNVDIAPTLLDLAGISVPAEDERARRFGAVASGEELLFDRTLDEGENVDLMKYAPSEAAEYRSRLEAHLARGDARVRKSDVRIDPAIAEKLRAMGYLQ